MKKPYREGMWFDVPLGDGVRAPALLLADRHHVLDIAAFSPGGRNVWSGSVSDRGLLVNRWRAIEPPRTLDDPVHERTAPFLRTAHAERAIARACGSAVPGDEPMRVYDCGRAAPREPALHEANVLQWRTPIADDALVHVRDWIASGERRAIRVYGPAVDQLERIGDCAVHALTLTSLPRVLPEMPSVRRLVLESGVSLEPLARAFPNLRALRIAARDHDIDLAPLRGCASLRALDCSHVRIARIDDLASLASLRALRLARIDGLDRLDALLDLPIETLALEEQPLLHALSPLARVQTLQQLELRGLWQFNVDEMEWLYALPRLVRATIDIGGRRKHAELYRRASWACAWPFYFGMD